MSTPRTIIALAIGAIGITAAVIAIRNIQPRETTTILRPTPDANVEQQAEGFLTIDAAGADTIVGRVEQAIASKASEVPDGDQIAADASQILTAWLTGSGNDYLAYLAAAGHPPPPADLWNDPQRRDAAWLDSTSKLRHAAFDPDGVTVGLSTISGEAEPDAAARNGVTGWRLNKLSGFDAADPITNATKMRGLTAREVRIPMHTTGFKEDTELIGQLSLTYARDPETTEWTLVAVSVFDIPLGETARTPPF